MSAFICGKRTIDHVVYAFVTILERYDNLFHGEPTDIGLELLKMNVAAVNYRYREKNAVPAYIYTEPSPKPSIIQAYKDARCLRYQSSEGNVPKSRTYKCLNALIDKLADDIVTELPEYEQAEWGSEYPIKYSNPETLEM